MLITEFFADREIFITGGTGFLGKALIEKLLRDCPKIKIIYILLRANKSLNAEQRLEELKKNRVFDRIRRECPQALSKLYAIEGDSQQLGLAIKASDLDLLKNVSLIFHMAANVKFDDPLRSSILLNTRGTYELVKIAEKLKNLIAFMHCSTAFCNPLEYTVEEKVYKLPADWRKTIKMAEQWDDYTINAFTKKYTGYYPNTYTFTKNLSEQIIQEYSSKLPMYIMRPSVVVNALSEPVPGWIDNLNGPIAAMIGLHIGIVPMFYALPDLKLDCSPIDTVTKLTIVAAFKRGMQTLKKETIPNGLEVANCISDGSCRLTMEQGDKLYRAAAMKNPMENCMWSFDQPTLTSCYYHFLLYIIMINIPASLLVDNILRLMGKKPMLLKITRRVIYTASALEYFSNNRYDMKNQNMFKLDKCIPESEIEIFGTRKDILAVDYGTYFDHIARGFKVNIFNQPHVSSDGARLRYKILGVLNKTIKLIIFGFIVRYLWFKLNY